jgi:hypothetical protein
LTVRVVVSDAALELIRNRGGRLYVSVKASRCCGANRTLVTAHEPPAGKDFRSVASSSGFELFMSRGLTNLPNELHVDRGRFSRRVDAYWNGCAWIV